MRNTDIHGIEPMDARTHTHSFAHSTAIPHISDLSQVFGEQGGVSSFLHVPDGAGTEDAHCVFVHQEQGGRLRQKRGTAHHVWRWEEPEENPLPTMPLALASTLSLGN